MRKIRIAIVDNGVRIDHPAFQSVKPKVIRYHSGQNNESCGHGAAIYNIIRKTVAFADIINFKVSEDDMSLTWNGVIHLENVEQIITSVFQKQRLNISD